MSSEEIKEFIDMVTDKKQKRTLKNIMRLTYHLRGWAVASGATLTKMRTATIWPFAAYY